MRCVHHPSVSRSHTGAIVRRSRPGTRQRCHQPVAEGSCHVSHHVCQIRSRKEQSQRRHGFPLVQTTPKQCHQFAVSCAAKPPTDPEKKATNTHRYTHTHTGTKVHTGTHLKRERVGLQVLHRRPFTQPAALPLPHRVNTVPSAGCTMRMQWLPVSAT